jgi:hypothetical protein
MPDFRKNNKNIFHWTTGLENSGERDCLYAEVN